MAALTPISMPTEETPLCPISPSIERPQREILAPDPAMIDNSIPDYSDIPLVGFTRLELY